MSILSMAARPGKQRQPRLYHRAILLLACPDQGTSTGSARTLCFRDRCQPPQPPTCRLRIQVAQASSTVEKNGSVRCLRLLPHLLHLPRHLLRRQHQQQLLLQQRSKLAQPSQPPHQLLSNRQPTVYR